MKQGRKSDTDKQFAKGAQAIQENFAAIMGKMKEQMVSLEDAIFAKDAKTRAELLDRIFHANLGMMTTGLSPAALTVAYTDWLAHLAIAPNKRLELAELAFKQLADFYKNVSEYLFVRETACFDIKDKRLKHRFQSDEWKAWPFCAIAQGFLNLEEWWREALDIRGVARNHKDLISFVCYQWLDAFSPENNIFLNPDVIKKTLQTKGQNLIDGWQNWQEDFWRYLKGERIAGTENFIVGKDVAVTKGKVVFRNELFELIQYQAQTKTVYPEPMLIIPAWIMKYYILDLSPQNSLVDFMVKRGHTVFMISWKNPDAHYRNYGMEDYLKKGILQAMDVVTDISGQEQIHATGYCIGGTILTMAASYMARHKNRHLKTITLFAAQTDFEEAGELMTFIDENQLCYLEDIMFSQGYLRGDQMSAAFELLRSKELIWSKGVGRYLLGERQPLKDLLAWNSDVTRLPYKLHAQYLRYFHLNNDFVKGEYKIDGKLIALEDIRLPLFVVATEKDHIAPWKSVYKIHLYTKWTDITFVLTNKGHNGGIIAEPGHDNRSYRIGKTEAASHYKTPEDWYDEQSSHPGSWWPVWHEWIAAYSGTKISPPRLGNPEKGYKPICNAPGRYVKER
ncbi:MULTISPECIES: PHA/PHB synthase family protein [Legionella]|nr:MULTISPECIES: alpha/beta fold hydrolase [Legionella]MCP0913660.1 alpha/beta fold hydrolase [Legionella sp. 27cVA30]